MKNRCSINTISDNTRSVSGDFFHDTLLTLALLLPLFSFNLAFAATIESGPAFSDHSHMETMPDQWTKQPLKYENMPTDLDLAITLDQHLYPALLPLIKQFGRKHNLRIAVEEGTCGISAGALLDKKVDIGGFCCPAGETDRLPGLTYHTLGIAALALIVHPDNPVIGLTLEQARDIYRGRIGNWGDLNKDFSQPIQTIARLHCKTRPGHWRLILDNEDLFSPSVREVSTIGDMINLARSQKSSLGYETLWMANLHAGKSGVKALAVNGITPDNERALISTQYPFYRTYNISTWSADHLRKPYADQFVNYIYDHFNDVEAKYGLISSERLRKAGWKFSGNELIDTPNQKDNSRR